MKDRAKQPAGEARDAMQELLKTLVVDPVVTAVEGGVGRLAKSAIATETKVDDAMAAIRKEFETFQESGDERADAVETAIASLGKEVQALRNTVLSVRDTVTPELSKLHSQHLALERSTQDGRDTVVATIGAASQVLAEREALRASIVDERLAALKGDLEGALVRATSGFQSEQRAVQLALDSVEHRIAETREFLKDLYGSIWGTKENASSQAPDVSLVPIDSGLGALVVPSSPRERSLAGDIDRRFAVIEASGLRTRRLVAVVGAIVLISLVMQLVVLLAAFR